MFRPPLFYWFYSTTYLPCRLEQKRPPIILTDNRWSCTKSLRFLTKRAADWYKIGTGTRKFTFYGILSNADTFVFCILLLNRLHRGDTFRNRLTMLRDASQSRFHLRSRYSQSFVIRRHSRSFAVNLLSLEEFCCQTKRSVRALLCCFKKCPV